MKELHSHTHQEKKKTSRDKICSEKQELQKIIIAYTNGDIRGN